MHSGLLSREEEESIWPVTEDRWAHDEWIVQQERAQRRTNISRGDLKASVFCTLGSDEVSEVEVRELRQFISQNLPEWARDNSTHLG